MNDYDDEDPHALQDDVAFASHSGGGLGLGEELLDAVSPDASFDGAGGEGSVNGTPRKGRATTVGVLDLPGDSLADELGGGSGTLGDELVEVDQGNHSPETDDTAEDEEAKAAARQARYESMASSLAESVRTSESFLLQLQSVVAGQGGSAGMTSSISTSSLGSAAGENEPSTTMTADERMELSGNQIVLHLRQAAKERDSQVRELQEIVRALGRTDDAAMQAAIVETWLSDDDEQENAGAASWLQPVADSGSDEVSKLLGFGSASTSSAPAQSAGRGRTTPLSPLTTNHHNEQSNGRLADVAEDEDEEEQREASLHTDEEDENHAPSSTPLIPPGPSRKAPVSAHLTHLQSITISLLGSLSHLNESSQISQASFREATKQVRKLRNGLNDWKRELDVVEKSEKWIAERSHVPQATLQPHALAKKEISAFEERYDECLNKARLLLRPVRSTFIDTAVESFGDRIEGVTAGVAA